MRQKAFNYFAYFIFQCSCSHMTPSIVVIVVSFPVLCLFCFRLLIGRCVSMLGAYIAIYWFDICWLDGKYYFKNTVDVCVDSFLQPETENNALFKLYTFVWTRSFTFPPTQASLMLHSVGGRRSRPVIDSSDTDPQFLVNRIKADVLSVSYEGG